MADELIESKIGPSWCKVDVVKLLRRIKNRKGDSEDGRTWIRSAIFFLG